MEYIKLLRCPDTLFIEKDAFFSRKNAIFCPGKKRSPELIFYILDNPPQPLGRNEEFPGSGMYAFFFVDNTEIFKMLGIHFLCSLPVQSVLS